MYNSEARVSNIVTRCVTIKEIGGDNSSFLTANAWSAVSFEEVDDSGDIIEYALGELTVDEFPASIQCADGTFEDVEISESDRVDNLTVTFSENGSVTVNFSEFEIDLDFETSTCENLVYIEDQFIATLVGTWSYNDVSKQLIMVLEITSSSDLEEIGDIEVIEFEVEFDESTSTLRLTEEFRDGDGGETIISEPA